MDRQPESPEKPECPEYPEKPEYPDYPENPGRQDLPAQKNAGPLGLHDQRGPGLKRRRRPTLPHCIAVPSAQAGLTSLFGMGRGGTPLQ